MQPRLPPGIVILYFVAKVCFLNEIEYFLIFCLIVFLFWRWCYLIEVNYGHDVNLPTNIFLKSERFTRTPIMKSLCT